MAFYQYIEYFKYSIDGAFEFTDNGRIVTKIEKNDTSRSVYGSEVIKYESIGIHRWEFKIIKGSFVAIGIDEAYYKWKHSAFWASRCEGTNHYAYTAYSGSKVDPLGQSTKCLTSYKTGDIVEMMLNMNTKKLSFSHNHTEFTEAFEIEKSHIGYCIAVFLRFKTDSVQLLSYQYTKE